MLNVTMNADGKSFLCSARQASAIQTLIDARKGGFARIKGYVSKSDRITPEVADITALTRVSTEKLYARKIEALRAINFEDVLPHIAEGSKLGGMTMDNLRQLFHDRREFEVHSMEQTLVGDRGDNRRAAHDKFYATIDTGVKVKFKTAKRGSDTVLVYSEGYPIVESIMLNYIPISKTVLVEGEYKHVNSGPEVLMSNIFAKLLPRSVKLVTASLKEDNFDELIIDSTTIVPDDIAGKYT